MFPAPFGHIKIKHKHHKWGSSSSSSSSSSSGKYGHYGNKALKKEQKRQRKAMKRMAKHGHYPVGYGAPGSVTVVQTRPVGPNYQTGVFPSYPTGCAIPPSGSYGTPGVHGYQPTPCVNPTFPTPGYGPPPPYSSGANAAYPSYPSQPGAYPSQPGAYPTAPPPGSAYPPYPGGPPRPY